MKPQIEQEIRDLAAPLRLPIPCSNPCCDFKVVYRGQFCARCRSEQDAEIARLRLKREARHV